MLFGPRVEQADAFTCMIALSAFLSHWPSALLFSPALVPFCNVSRQLALACHSTAMAFQPPQVQDAFRWLERKSLVSQATAPHEKPKCFIPPSIVRSHFDKERIRDILAANYSGTIHVGRLAKDIVENGYVLVFLILLRLGKLALISEFMRQPRWSDQYLPFTHAAGFPVGIAFDDFQAQQQTYCASPMHSGERLYEDVTILPIIEKKKIADGSSAIIHRVKIHPEYDKLGQDPNVDVRIRSFPSTVIGTTCPEY